jgi:hypothetical protein
VKVASTTAKSALVDLEVYGSGSTRAFTQVWDNQAFAAGVSRTFTATWTVPAGEALVAHPVKVGVFSPGWGTLYLWNDTAASFAVTTPVATTTTTTTTTLPPTTTTTVPPTTTTTVPAVPWTATATASPTQISPGTTVTFTARVTSSTTRSALVDLEVYAGTQARNFQQVWDNQAFAAGVSRTFTATWTVPAGEPLDTHSVQVGVFNPGWGTLYLWNGKAASFVVTTPATTTTTTTTPTTTIPPTTTTTRPATTTTTAPSSGLPALPAGWPTGLQMGSGDSPGGAAALRGIAPMSFRYQYLAGGANTGSGWSTWNPNGTFVTNYIQESRQVGMVPVFSYYMMLQSSPGSTMGEPAGVYANITNSSTMAAYYNDLKLFFQRAGQAGGVTVLHVEPDLWAYLQQKSTNDDARTVPMKVGGSGQSDVTGLPDNAAGFGQAIVHLRDVYAPNVDLGYSFSAWAVGGDFVYGDPADSVVDGLGVRNANFYKSMGARFDVAFTDLSDRDAAFKQYVYGDGGGSWFTADDYRRSNVFIGAFVRTARLRVVIWQIPLGNTKMRAENNTWNHYQDNKVEWLLEDPSRAHLAAYANAGVVAFLFGRGGDGPTCACDANNDGVTNPAAINGNNRISLSADDDGGYWHERTVLYYQTGAMALP